MRSDWKPGDLALCVHEMGWHPLGLTRAPNDCSPIKAWLAPRVGSIWQVAGVEIHERCEWEEKRVLFLRLEGQPSDIVFNSQFFMKLDEDSEAVGIVAEVHQHDETPDQVVA